MILAQLHRLPVEVMKAELLAEAGDLCGGLMIAGQDIDVAAARLQNFAALIQAASPIHKVASSKVVVGFRGDELLESLMVTVNIRKNEQLQRPMIALEAA